MQQNFVLQVDCDRLNYIYIISNVIHTLARAEKPVELSAYRHHTYENTFIVKKVFRVRLITMSVYVG